jgi:hypothetical protein
MQFFTNVCRYMKLIHSVVRGPSWEAGSRSAGRWFPTFCGTRTFIVPWGFPWFSSSGLAQPPIHWLPGALSLGVKLPAREADLPVHQMPRLRMRAVVSPLPQYVFMTYLFKGRDNFT